MIFRKIYRRKTFSRIEENLAQALDKRFQTRKVHVILLITILLAILNFLLLL